MTHWSREIFFPRLSVCSGWGDPDVDLVEYLRRFRVEIPSTMRYEHYSIPATGALNDDEKDLITFEKGHHVTLNVNTGTFRAKRQKVKHSRCS